MSAVSEDPQLDTVIELFNRREFFACHDVLEEIWSESIGEERAFWQGLIHAAVALFHFGEGNLGGARKMYDSTLRYLAAYGETHGGINLRQFRLDFRKCFAQLLEDHVDYPSHVRRDETRIPRLHRIPPYRIPPC